MTVTRPHPWLHRLAVSTVLVAMVTLIFGALVTSKNAGMAFRDWPTSDGHFMLTYPWLKDLFAGDFKKFLEHTHRLAGALNGLWSIGLVAAAWKLESRGWAKGLSVAILLGVICQGLLGGFRVQLDERGLAMLHGTFAALVFSLMGAMVLVTGRRWRDVQADTSGESLWILKMISLLVVAGLLGQYVLGGLIRHQGSALHEHLGMGFAVFGLIFLNAVLAGFSTNDWISRSAWLLMAATLVQVGLGLATWVFKFGYTPTGYVAVADSIQQVALRTTHTVWGIVVFMTAVVHCLKVFRVAAVTQARPIEPIVLRPSSLVLSKGGAG